MYGLDRSQNSSLKTEFSELLTSLINIMVYCFIQSS